MMARKALLPGGKYGEYYFRNGSDLAATTAGGDALIINMSNGGEEMASEFTR